MFIKIQLLLIFVLSIFLCSCDVSQFSKNLEDKNEDKDKIKDKEMLANDQARSKERYSQGCTLEDHGDHAKLKCSDGTDFTIYNGRDGSSCSVSKIEVGALITCEDGSSEVVRNGTSCTTKETKLGALIICEDGATTLVKNGKDGKDGKNGIDGQDGLSCSVTDTKTNAGALIQCEDGTTALISNGKDGQDGKNGKNGSSCSVRQERLGSYIYCTDGTSAFIQHGRDGKDGSNCHVSETRYGALIECSDGSNAFLRHGRDGEDGADGKDCSVAQSSKGSLISCDDGTSALIQAVGNQTNAYDIVAVINPCGAQMRNDEVILRFANGQLFGHYSDGIRQHFSFLAPGYWVTTDLTQCHFTVHEDYSVTW